MARDLLANYPIHLDEEFADCFYSTARSGFGFGLLMGPVVGYILSESFLLDGWII